MKKSSVFLSVLFLTAILTARGNNLHATTQPPLTLGIVNFATCVADSKLGKQEQASFEALKKQMAKLLEDTEKQLGDINAQFSDPDTLDQLSPDAEAELKMKFQRLSEELNRYQNQYYQVLNQANMRIFQMVSNSINDASEKVAKEKKLSLVLNKEACFFYNPSLDMTAAVIVEMDKQFGEQIKKTGASSEERAPVLLEQEVPVTLKK